ncbi:MAG: STAS domain-containing protein [Kiritimatiellae bacterium]|nr:STAS domain-containing protein [Kiritimatiellia bacterium]
MNIDKKLENGQLSIALSGRLDTNTSPDLESELKLDGVSEIAFDFASLEYISSAGLRVLMTAQKAMMACGGKMTIAHPNDMVKGVFDMTGLSSVFTLIP